MLKIIEAELRYNWVPITIVFSMITLLMTGIMFAGEDNWYGPSGLYGILIVFNMATINVIYKKEKRLFSNTMLPVSVKTLALARSLFYGFLVVAGNLIPLLVALLISPEILNPVTMGRYFLVAGSLLAINGSYLVVTDTSSIFQGKYLTLKFFGVVGIIILANAIFYAFIVIEMPKRYNGILHLFGLAGYKEQILQFLYNWQTGWFLILLGIMFLVSSYFTFMARKRYTA